MKKVIVGMSCILICIALGGCVFNSEDNPLNGKSTDDRIVIALEKTYPEHVFDTVKKYAKYNGKYYSVCEDENGVQFKVDHIIYDNRYHFGCYDEYLLELLKQQNFLNLATNIASQYDCTVDYSENGMSIIIPLSNNMSAFQVAEMMKKIVNSVQTPSMYIGNEEFSTGEVNYYTISDLRAIGYTFITSDENWVAAGSVGFEEKDLSTETLSKEIEIRLNEAYTNINE